MTTAVRVARGTVLTLWDLWRRLWAAGEKDHDRIGPIALLAFLIGALGWVLQRAPIAGAPLTLALLVAGYLRGGRPTAAAEADDNQEQPEQQQLPDTETLAAALHHLGTPHVHLAVLAEHMGLTAAATRDACKVAGIPTTPVRMKGRGSSTGVRQADFPPLPAPDETPPAAVVAAGQDDNNNGNNAPTVETREGMTIIRDPADHARRRGTVRPRT